MRFDWLLGGALILIILVQFPGALLLLKFGKLAYLKDIFGAILCSYLVLVQVPMLLKQSGFRWFVAAVTVFGACFVCAMSHRVYFLSGLLILKWCYLWTFAFVSGVWFSAANRRPLLVLLVLSLIFYCGLELALGQWERQSGGFFLMTGSSEVTEMGSVLAKKQSIEGEALRVRGFQRDVFQYANLMLLAMGVMLALTLSKTKSLRFLAVPFAMAFGYGALTSGGRSAALGVVAALVFWVLWLLLARFRRAVFISSLCFFVLLNAVVMVRGVTWIVEPISNRFSSRTALVSDSSSVMRDEIWAYFRSTLKQHPEALVLGFPVASLLSRSSDVSVIVTTDNVLYGMLWHCGLLVGVILMAFTIKFLRCYVWWDEKMGGAAILLFAIMSEAIARDVQFFWTFLGLLFLLGFNLFSGRGNVPVMKLRHGIS